MNEEQMWVLLSVAFVALAYIIAKYIYQVIWKVLNVELADSCHFWRFFYACHLALLLKHLEFASPYRASNTEPA